MHVRTYCMYLYTRDAIILQYINTLQYLLLQYNTIYIYCSILQYLLPGPLVTINCVPGFLKSLLCGCTYVSMCVCVCVSVPELVT